jgi:hypothetical protein
MTTVYAVHNTAPVTARLRHQPDAPLVIETAPIATSGENGRTQKQARVRIASSFVIRPGVASVTGVLMRETSNVAIGILYSSSHCLRHLSVLCALPFAPSLARS